MVVCRLSDDGGGISSDNLAKIFDPFFTTKEIGKGTGLNLSICYALIQSMGGTITARSEVGAGATFSIYLPAAV
jgi:signal transduction histidine kinase